MVFMEKALEVNKTTYIPAKSAFFTLRGLIFTLGNYFSSASSRENTCYLDDIYDLCGKKGVTFFTDIKILFSSREKSNLIEKNFYILDFTTYRT